MAATLSLHAEELTNSCCADGSTSFEQHSATGATTTTAETTDDAAATMIGCMKLFHRQDGLTVSSMSRNGNGASATSLADVIETDYLRDWTCSRDSHVDDDNSSSHNSDQRSKGILTDSEANLSYGTFEEQLDKDCWANLLRMISKSLHQTFTIQGHQCDVVVSQELLKKISADILRMSQNEPLGINGCSIEIRLEQSGLTSGLCELKYDASSECMFVIIISLREDDKHWYGGIDNLATLIPAMFCCRHSLLHSWVCISQAYKLEKVKLYSTHHAAR